MDNFLWRPRNFKKKIHKQGVILPKHLFQRFQKCAKLREIAVDQAFKDAVLLWLNAWES